MNWIVAQMAIGIMIAIAVAITPQISAAMSESDTLSSASMSAQSEDNIVKIQALSEAEQFLVQAREPVAERAMWMMHNSGRKPTWALLMGGLMVGGAVVMASSSDDENDHHSNSMPLMMGLVGTGLLVYYFVSDDEPRRIAQPVGGDRHQAWYKPFSLGIRRDALLAVGTWRF